MVCSFVGSLKGFSSLFTVSNMKRLYSMYNKNEQYDLRHMVYYRGQYVGNCNSLTLHKLRQEMSTFITPGIPETDFTVFGIQLLAA